MNHLEAQILNHLAEHPDATLGEIAHELRPLQQGHVANTLTTLLASGHVITDSSVPGYPSLYRVTEKGRSLTNTGQPATPPPDTTPRLLVGGGADYSDPFLGRAEAESPAYGGTCSVDGCGHAPQAHRFHRLAQNWLECQAVDCLCMGYQPPVPARPACATDEEAPCHFTSLATDAEAEVREYAAAVARSAEVLKGKLDVDPPGSDLVAIDFGPAPGGPAAAAEVLRLAAEDSTGERERLLVWLADQLHPEPEQPRLEEPMGRAALVKDRAGEVWVSWRDGTGGEHEQPWLRVHKTNPEGDMAWSDWADLDVTEILYPDAMQADAVESPTTTTHDQEK